MSKKKEIIIGMYLAARQFNRAINLNEIIVVPNTSKIRDFFDIIGFGYIVSKSDKVDTIINKTLPFIVNKSLSCEIYMKLILFEKQSSLNGKEEFNKSHDLISLFKLSNLIDDFEKYIIANKLEVKKEAIEANIEKLSYVFIKFRYIYEYRDSDNIVYHDFLNVLTDFLDSFCIDLIKSNYDYDVTGDVR